MQLFIKIMVLVGFILTIRIASLEAQGLTGNPVNSAADVAKGAKMFRSLCANCHGRSGTGARGPDLTRGQFRYGNTDAALFKVIYEGIPRTGMPGMLWWRSEKDVWLVVAFVRSLNRASTKLPLAGNAVAGSQLFREKAECNKCHIVNGKGGRQGPDLSNIGWMRSPEHLRTSIIKPSAEVLPRWWTMQVTDRQGAIVKGLRMDEDSYSIRIMDEQDNLRSFLKSDLPAFERIESSTMPSYEGALSEREVDDLVAYLYSLRTGR